MGWEDGYREAQARAATNENAGLRGTVDTFADALDEANATIDRAQAIITAKNQQITALKHELAAVTEANEQNWTAWCVERASAEGLRAYYQALKQASPDSPALADSGNRFKDGDIKTVGRMLYEKSFDAALLEHLPGPVDDYRTD